MATKMEQVIAGLLALDDLEASRAFRNRVATAADPVDMTKKIEALRKQFKEQSLQVSYESKQKLAGLLREISHVLTDLIHAMNVNGEDAAAMQKLQQQVGKVTRSLSFVGEDDADGDGIKDDVAHEANLDLGGGKSVDDSHKAFKDAVKTIKSDKPASKEEDPKNDATKESKPAKEKEAPVIENKHSIPKKEDAEESDDSEEGAEDAEDAEDDSDSKKPIVKKSTKKIPLKKTSKSEKSDDAESDNGGFVSGLLAESSYQALAGFRFAYLGPKVVKKSGESFTVLLAGFGSHDSDTFKVYYYKPTAKFFGGDAAKVNKAFSKIMEAANGYSKLSNELRARVKSGHLEIVARKEQAASEVLTKAVGVWSYKGLGEHPSKEDRKAIWFEIGAQEFAAIPSKKFESGDVGEADSYIQVNIMGSKSSGAAGKSYGAGLAALEALVDSGKLKVIYHGNI